MLLLMGLAVSGCANKAKTQAQIRRAYAAGQESMRAQMEHTQQPPAPQQMGDPADPQVRILGPVKTPVLLWSEGLTLGRALVEANYLRDTTPSAITIYRNNFPLDIDPQTLLQGRDYPLYPGDIVHIQE